MNVLKTNGKQQSVDSAQHVFIATRSPNSTFAGGVHGRAHGARESFSELWHVGQPRIDAHA
jgi:hypothetical protein